MSICYIFHYLVVEILFLSSCWRQLVEIPLHAVRIDTDDLLLGSRVESSDYLEVWKKEEVSPLRIVHNFKRFLMIERVALKDIFLVEVGMSLVQVPNIIRIPCFEFKSELSPSKFMHILVFIEFNRRLPLLPGKKELLQKVFNPTTKFLTVFILILYTLQSLVNYLLIPLHLFLLLIILLLFLAIGIDQID